MTSLLLHASRPHKSILPRPYTDAHHRYHVYGPIVPMDRPGFFERLFFGRR